MAGMTSAAGAATQVGIGGITAIAGAFKAAKAKKELNNLLESRPVLEATSSEKEISRISALQAMRPGLPGEDKMISQVDQSQANTLEAAMQSGSGDIYRSQVNRNEALNQIGVQSAQQRLQSEINRISTLEKIDSAQKERWRSNVFEPYKDKVDSARADLGAAKNLVNQGVNMAMSGAAGFIQPKPSNTTPDTAGFKSFMAAKSVGSGVGVAGAPDVSSSTKRIMNQMRVLSGLPSI